MELNSPGTSRRSFGHARRTASWPWSRAGSISTACSKSPRERTRPATASHPARLPKEAHPEDEPMADPTPDLFLDAVLGFQKTAALKAALALDLFTVVGQESGDRDRIAARTGASERGIRILCDYLTVQGFLTKTQDRYGLTPASEVFLTTTSRAWMGSVVEFLASPEMIGLWLDDPVSYVRNGGAVGLGSLAPDHPVWVKFARAMVPFMRPVADAVAQTVRGWPTAPKRVLDIAAGHGLFGIALAQAISGVQITAVDWSAVL